MIISPQEREGRDKKNKRKGMEKVIPDCFIEFLHLHLHRFSGENGQIPPFHKICSKKTPFRN